MGRGVGRVCGGGRVEEGIWGGWGGGGGWGFFFSSRRRHTRYWRDWNSDVCSSDLETPPLKLKFLPQTGAGRPVGYLQVQVCLDLHLLNLHY